MAPALKMTRDTNMQLPFVVRHNASRTSFMRTWRSLPRLKRSAVLAMLFLCLLGLVYTFSSSVETPELVANPRDFINARDIPQRKEAVEEAAANADPPAHAQNRPPKIPKFTGPTNERQRAVVEAFQHAWRGYTEFAWGHDQLKPLTGSYQEWFDTGLTIVDGLDTAIIMGLDKEVANATEWIRNSLNFEKDRYVNLFEATIRVLGGLLSAFHLTGEPVFLEKAKDVAARLSGAFASKSPVPLSDVNLKTREAKGPSWSGESSLSEVTTIQLEFRDLSRVIGNATYENLAFKVSQHVHEIGCSDQGGLCGMYINANTGKFRDGTTITFGARADSYYEYLLKQWIQTGKTIPWLLDDYKQAMTSMESKLVRQSEPKKLVYVGELLAGKSFSPKMDHLVCFISGTLALGTLHGLPAHHLELAKGIGESCKAFYETPTGLAPEIAHFNVLPGKEGDIYIKALDAHCLLRPEAIEAWFYLYRTTGDKKYQEWGWTAFQAIEKYAKVKRGYSSVNNVKKIPVTHRDLMESFFLAETLKYLYLLLADDQEMLPLTEYVFNTEGHPLPVYKH